MLRFAFAAALLLTLAPAPSFALEFKNIRSSYGPLGATRTDNKFLPGDLLYISYEIEGLKVDPKSKKAAYVTLLEVFSSTKEKIFSKETPNEMAPQLGGDRIPGDLHLIMGRDKPAGQYLLRMTIQDRVGGETKSFTHSFELLKPGFGIVAVMAPAIAFPGQPYLMQLAIIDFTLDANKSPKGSIVMKVFDESGKEVSTLPANKFPDDLDAATAENMKKDNVLPMHYPIFPNRPGRFNIEFTAVDALSNKTSVVRYQLLVLDLYSMTTK
jgi:hypothetical protein